MSNHLIIGLGGTGGKVLRELRKRVYEEFRSNDPGRGVHLDYVYLDSSPADLNDRTGWKVIGKSVHLGEAQKVNINGINSNVLQNLSMYPGLQSFISDTDKQLMDRHMGPLISAGIGGQRRRLGRVLVANNLGDSVSRDNLNNVIHSAVTRLQQDSNDQDVTFHICAGLAGGTGSGSIIDVLSQIRKKYPYNEGTKAFKIRLFLYIPESVMVYSDHDSGFYQANGYAALQELNAVSVGKYHPLDVTGEKDVYTQEVKRLLEGESFEAAYIYSNVNEAGKILDLGTQLPASVADFMFQTIVVANMNGSAGKMSRLVGCENDGAAPEQDLNGENNRSRKFLSFGITRIEYPETEIDEYMSYSYAIQATRQLTYNLWQEGVGYGECSIEEVGSGYADEIKNVKNREQYKLSNSYLTLAKPIIDSANTKKWKDFSTTWETRTQQDAALVQSQYEKKLWLAEFTKLVDDYYENSFRAHGVKKFYEIQQQELKGYARHLRRHIEKILFDQWAAGGKEGKSILQIEKYAQLMRKDCQDRITAFKQQIARLEEERDGQQVAIDDANREWGKLGWPNLNPFVSPTQIFNTYKTAKCNYYITATRIDAYKYATLLLQELIIEMGSMIEGIQAMKKEMDDILTEVTKQAGNKCRTSEAQEDGIVKKYDPERVHALAKQYSINFENQSGNAAEIRTRMIAGLGEEGERTFANLYANTDYETAIDIVLDVCTKNARMAMEDSAKNDPMMKMVGVNILDKLKNELNTEEKMEAFVKQAVGWAQSYVQFNAEERSKVIAGTPAVMQSMVQVAMPRAEGATLEFKNRLLQVFQNTIPGFVPSPDADLSENYKTNQIVIVCANSGFPLRYLANLTTLKQKYDQLLAAPEKDLNRMVLHTESFKEALPALFEKDSKENFADAKKPLMLAFALNQIQPQQDPTTGERFYAMNIPDDVFGDSWVKIGKNFEGCLNALAQDYRKLQQLKAQVAKELTKQARSNDQKAEVRKALGGVVNQLILPTMCEGNQFSPVYNEYKALAVEIINAELKDL